MDFKSLNKDELIMIIVTIQNDMKKEYEEKINDLIIENAKNYCDDCGHLLYTNDDWNNRTTCEDCGYENICVECGRKCACCGKQICNKKTNMCEYCYNTYDDEKKYYCINCINICTVCDEYHCDVHSEIDYHLEVCYPEKYKIIIEQRKNEIK